MNKGKSMQHLAKIMGLPLCTYDLNQIAKQFEDEGLVTNLNISPKGTFADVTDLGLNKINEL